MANILQDQYKSVFSSSLDSYPELEVLDTIFNDCHFDTNDFIEAIKALSPNAASGPDGYPAKLLVSCKEEIAPALNIFWKNCFASGETPALLKTNFVAPIYKRGDQGDPVNYRPVSSHLKKTFEKVLIPN